MDCRARGSMRRAAALLFLRRRRGPERSGCKGRARRARRCEGAARLAGLDPNSRDEPSIDAEIKAGESMAQDGERVSARVQDSCAKNAGVGFNVYVVELEHGLGQRVLALVDALFCT